MKSLILSILIAVTCTTHAQVLVSDKTILLPYTFSLLSNGSTIGSTDSAAGKVALRKWIQKNDKDHCLAAVINEINRQLRPANNPNLAKIMQEAERAGVKISAEVIARHDEFESVAYIKLVASDSSKRQIWQNSSIEFGDGLCSTSAALNTSDKFKISASDYAQFHEGISKSSDVLQYGKNMIQPRTPVSGISSSGYSDSQRDN